MTACACNSFTATGTTTAVTATSGTGDAIYATTASTDAGTYAAVQAVNTGGGPAIIATTAGGNSTTCAIYGTSSGLGAGVIGSNTSTNNSTYGVYGSVAGAGFGVYGTSSVGGATGVQGSCSGTYAAGVVGQATATGSTGVYGNGNLYGVFGSGVSYGIYGTSTTASATGVLGTVSGTSAIGVSGTYTGSGTGTGVYGSGSTGVQARGTNYGVYASGVTYGVYAELTNPTGGTAAVYAVGGGNGLGLYASSPNGYSAIEAYNSGTGWAVNAQGPVFVSSYLTTNGAVSVGTSLSVAANATITGTLYVGGYITKSGGGYLVDHPQDPENKFLNHCFVESPEMKNVYDGVAMLDSTGRATITMPDYFQAANSDYRYQLTSVGGSAPGLYVSAEISGNTFHVAGGVPNGKVSWMVTGVRADKWALANNPGVEIDKKDQKGLFLHPELFGFGKDKQFKLGGAKS